MQSIERVLTWNYYNYTSEEPAEHKPVRNAYTIAVRAAALIVHSDLWH